LQEKLQVLQRKLSESGLIRRIGYAVAGIKEVADEAGVSTATVSRALRGLQHVNEATRAKIIAAAEKLDYPLTRADSPAGRTNSVGVVAPYISRWYFSQVISGAEQALREAGLDLLLYNFSAMKGRERLFQHQLLKGRVDALIVISLPPTEEEFDSILSLGIPIALVGMDHAQCASVKIDDVAAARTATQHLVNQGHKKIGLMSGRPDDPFNFSVPQDRRKGFMQVLAENHLEWLPSREVHGDFTCIPHPVQWMIYWPAPIGQRQYSVNPMRWQWVHCRRFVGTV